MARTKEELRELITVLKELKATANLGIDADLEKLNTAISKVKKGDTSGFQDIITAAQDMKRVLKESLDIDPTGLNKVNQALAETIRLTREAANAPEAFAGLAGQEKNQLRYLQSAPVPASIARQQAAEAEAQFRLSKPEVFNPLTESPTSKSMLLATKRSEVYQSALEEEAKTLASKSAAEKELLAQEKESEAQRVAATNRLAATINAEAEAAQKAVQAKLASIEATQQELLQQEIAKRQAEIAARKADDIRLQKLGEETFAHPNAVSVGITRNAEEEKRAAEATAQGEKAARQKAEDEKDAALALEQQFRVAKLIEDIERKRNPQVFDPNYRSPESLRMQAEAQREVSPVNQVNPQAAALQAFGGNLDKLDAFDARLGKLGFKMTDLTRISKDAATGITTMSGSMVNANGVAEELSVHIDRFGNVVQTSSNNFKSFGDVLINNTKKMLEWVVAGGLIFGAIAKMKEVFGNMSELQVKLNEITITSGQTGEALRGTFQSVVDIADRVGIGAVDSLTAMNYALKITGDSATPVERTAKATQLLAASLTLAKLGAIPVNEAMDTLVAALEQSGTKFEDVNKLLDSFQAVAKTTGGSIHDMATTFGITAGAAADVGVGVDELNGIIGAFAAVTTKSAEETGNALKVMFSNFQSDKAVNALQKYGIAVKDFTTGETRNFQDVMQDVSDRMNAGLITKGAQSEIANAIGGGGRRAADVTALLNAWEKVAGQVETSATASGDATAALEIKSKTLESAVNVLNNAFLELSNSLGDQGGFVQLMTDSVKSVTGLVQALNSITGALGPLTTAFSTLIALNFVNKLFGNQIKEQILNFGTLITSTVNKMDLLARNGFRPSLRTLDNSGQEIAGATGQSFVGGIKANAGAIAGAFAPVLGMSLIQASQGQGAQALAGGVAGLFMAGVTKSAGWASIGAALASIIVTEIQDITENNRKAKEAETAGIQTFQEFKQLNPKATPEEWQTAMTARLQDLSNSLKFGNRATQLGTGLDASQIAQVAVKQYQVLQSTAPELLDKYFALKSGKGVTDREAANAEVITITKQLSDILRSQGAGITQAPGFRGGAVPELVLTAENFNSVALIAKGLGEVFKDLTEITKETTDAQNNQLASQVAFNNAFGEQGTAKQNQLRNNLLFQMGQPGSEVQSPTQYQQLLQQGKDVTTTVPQVLAARHPEVQLKQEAQKYSDEYNDLFNILARTNAERANYISQVANEINGLNIAIKEGKVTDINATKEQLVYLQKLLDINIQIAKVESAKSQVVYPGFTDLREMSKQQVLKAAQSAEKLQNYTVREMGIDPDLFKQSLDDIYVMTRDGLIKVKGLGQDFFSPAIDGVKNMKKELEDAFNFQNLRDYPIDIAGRLQKAMNYYQNLLKQWGLNEKIEKMTFLFKDNQVSQLVGSQTALQLALQDLTQVEKKQLDGIYNLPSGATAFIPLQSGQMLANNTANNAVANAPYDYGNLPTPELTPLKNPLDQISFNTSKTNELLANGFSTDKVPTANNNIVPLKPSESFANDWKKLFPWMTPKEITPPYAPPAQTNLLNLKAPQETPEQKVQRLAPIDRNYLLDNFIKFSEEQKKQDNLGGKALYSRLPEYLESTKTPAGTELKSSISLLEGAVRGMSVVLGLKNKVPDPAFFGSKSDAEVTKAIQIQVKPEKVTNEYNTSMTLRVDGRVLATIVKQYLFEDYQRLTASVGNNSRTSTGVI